MKRCVRLINIAQFYSNCDRLFILGIISILFYYRIINHKFKVYNTVVWGSGSISRTIASLIPDSILVSPASKNSSQLFIKNTEVKINSSVNPIELVDFNYSKCTLEEIDRLSELTDRSRRSIIEAEKRLIDISGERFTNCYYYRFDKLRNYEKTERKGIEKIVKDNGIQRIIFTDKSYIRTRKVVYADTGNIEEMIRFFGLKELSVYLSLGYIENCMNTGRVIFGKKNDTEYVVNNDTVIFYKNYRFAHGTMDNLECCFEYQDELERLNELKISDGGYIINSNAMIQVPWNDKIRCLSPNGIVSGNPIRDILILSMLN